MRTNTPTRHAARTHEGGRADPHVAPLDELRRLVMTCLLFERSFYSSGLDLAERIAELVHMVQPREAVEVAIEARNQMRLRHVGLWVLRHVLNHPHRVPAAGAMIVDAFQQVIRRPDELGEFMAMYESSGGNTARMPSVAKRGIASALQQFDEYQLAKWDRAAKWRIRDVIRMAHPRPKNTEQSDLWRRATRGELATPDTWEVALSSGADKRATWERLIAGKRLGQMALLMNVRNMVAAGVRPEVIGQAILDRSGPAGVALPFRYLTAARHAPALAADLSRAMLASIPRHPQWPAGTVVLVDVSGSMAARLSGRSETTRMDAAAGVAVLIRHRSAAPRILTFSNHLVEVPNHEGIPLAAAILQSQPHIGTALVQSIQAAMGQIPGATRMVVITDEQAMWYAGTMPPPPPGGGVIVNVAPERPALPVTQAGWLRVNGFSDRVVEYIEAVAENLPPGEALG